MQAVCSVEGVRDQTFETEKYEKTLKQLKRN